MTRVRFKVDLSGLKPAMREVFGKQLPYATSLALTATAGHVGQAWQQEIETRLDRPTPFTVKSVAVVAARKSRLEAIVFVKDIAAAYLQPFVIGGVHALGKKRGILAPKQGLSLNAYGNIPQGRLKSLKGRKDTFVGAVRLKSGQVVSGAWQRVGAQKTGRRRKGAQPAQTGSHLKLLIRFSDPLPVKPVLRFAERAEQAVAQRFPVEFAKAWSKALATAR